MNIFKGKVLFVLTFTVMLLIVNLVVAEDGNLDRKIDECADLFEEVMMMPDVGIPEDLINGCSGIIIFPSVLKGGFIIAGRVGSGIIMHRDPDTGEWSAPAFCGIGGVSYGLQIGGQAIDLILVVTSERGMKALLDDNITLGADMAASAGPVGRNAEVDTDLLMRAGIFSYSRSRGLFAGIALEGAILAHNKDSNESYYGVLSPEEILYGGVVEPSPTAMRLISLLEGGYTVVEEVTYEEDTVETVE